MLLAAGHSIACSHSSLLQQKLLLGVLSFTLQVWVDLYFAFKNKCRKSLCSEAHMVFPVESVALICLLVAVCIGTVATFTHIILHATNHNVILMFIFYFLALFLSSIQSWWHLTLVVPCVLTWVAFPDTACLAHHSKCRAPQVCPLTPQLPHQCQ